MVKLVVAYKKPKDVEEFERVYREDHLSKALRIPHLIKLALGKVVGMADGSPAPYHRIAELFFEDQAALTKAAGSEEGQAAVYHAMEIGTGGVDIMVVRVEREA